MVIERTGFQMNAHTDMRRMITKEELDRAFDERIPPVIREKL